MAKRWLVHTQFKADTPDGPPDSTAAILAGTELTDVELVPGASPDHETSRQRVQFHYNGKLCTCRPGWLQDHATEVLPMSPDQRKQDIRDRVDRKARAIAEGQGHWGENIIEEMRISVTFELTPEEERYIKEYTIWRKDNPL